MALSPDRWDAVERLFHAALARPVDERAAFLADACAGDEELRREVETLLVEHTSADAEFSRGAAVAAAGLVSDVDRSVLTGRRLGAYQILAPIGAGGMGEVYRARDTRLGREVAIKILPRAFTADTDRLARFDREARVLASLNHPHIAAIYGFEESVDVGAGFSQPIKALVLELIEGETLAERIMRAGSKALPVKEALDIARQIADALDAAHEKGIVHRDLKPANIKITPQGIVKVLDFGLAKLEASGAGEAGGDVVSEAPTITVNNTREGVIVGTAAYMSPEQARGHAVDKRTDIWAFGCVLYQMLSGRAPFACNTLCDTLAGILEREPDWNALPASTPPVIRTLLGRCLEKDPKRRRRDIGDVWIELDEPAREPQVERRVTRGPRAHGERLAWILTTILAVIASGLVLWVVMQPSPARLPEMRLDIATPPTTDPASLALSPDGKRIVFVADSERRPALWLRELDSVSARALAATEGAQLPFWSPDSRSLGFFADGKVKRIDIDTGSVRTVANASDPRGGTWSNDGTILFAPVMVTPILRVSSEGRDVASVTELRAPHETGHWAPQFLPDGRHFLYYVRGTAEVQGVYVGDVDRSEPRRLIDADGAAVYVPPQQLLFLRHGTVFGQIFDPARLALTGDPVAVAEEVTVDALGNIPALSASNAGSIAYRTGTARPQKQFVWFDRSGKELGTVAGNLVNAGGPSLSPDGRTLAVQRTTNGNGDVWMLDISRGVLTRLTYDPAVDTTPVWSPYGDRIALASPRTGAFDLFQKQANGGGDEELLLSTPQMKIVQDWSFDGRFLLYVSFDPTMSRDIWALPLDGDRKPFPVVRTDFEERDAQFSPDGKWIAYHSNESGRFEVYVQPFLTPGDTQKTKVQISTSGGAQVRWRSDGHELLYIAMDDRLMAVPMRRSANG